MKFTVMMKDPDALDVAIDDAIQEDESLQTMAKDEQKAAIAERKEEMRKAARQWFDYGECVFLEIDTEAKTCTVRERA